MKVLKWLISIIVLLVIIVALVVAGIAFFVNPNDYKGKIEKAFHEKTGMTLSLPGNLSWEFFPSVGLKTTALDIAKKATLKPFVKMINVDISVMPWSLLMGEISSIHAKAKAFEYDKMQFSKVDVSASNVNPREAFPFELNTTAKLGLPHPLHIDLKSDVKFVSEGSGSLYLTNILAKLNKSDLSGNMSVVDFDKPQINIDLNSNTFHVSDFVNLKGAELPLRDTAIKANLSAKGTNDKLFPSTLNGTINAVIGSSQLKGVDVGATLASIRNAVKGIGKSSKGFDLNNLSQIQSLLGQKSHTSGTINPNNGKVTDIGQFTLNGVVTGGVLKNDKILIDGKHYNMAGAGYVDLNKKTLDYNFNIYGKHNEVINGKTQQVPDDYVVPFFAKGPWDNIQKGINYPELSKQIQKLMTAKLKQTAIQKLTDKLGDKVPAGIREKVGGLLNGLFGH